MKKIIAIVAFAWLSFFTYVCMADNWCVLCLKGKKTKKEFEFVQKPKVRDDKEDILSGLFFGALPL